MPVGPRSTLKMCRDADHRAAANIPIQVLKPMLLAYDQLSSIHFPPMFGIANGGLSMSELPTRILKC